MKKLIIRVSPDTPVALKEMGDRFVQAWKTGRSDEDVLQFESPSALFRALSPKRWELLRRLKIGGSSSARGLARDLDRDVKRVHEDVTTLTQYGLVARTAEGKYFIPYDVIRADFDVTGYESLDSGQTTSTHEPNISVPSALDPLLIEMDDPDKPIDEIELAGRLQAALGDGKDLTESERRGAFAEIEGLYFQRARDAERRTWGIYWNELASATTVDGKQIYRPDIGQVDSDILAHWISRSESATNAVLRARFADLAWEIGRYVKAESRAKTAGDQPPPAQIDIPVSLAHRAIDAYLEAIERRLLPSEYHAWQFLDRAVELACSIRDDSRKASTKAALFQYHASVQPVSSKYMWWRFDDIAWERAKCLSLTSQEREDIIETVEQALARHSDSSSKETFEPHLAMTAADRLGRHYTLTGETPRAKRALKTAALAFEEAAKTAEALVASAWLEDVLRRYRNAGMVEDAARVERAVRSRAGDARAELKRIEVPLNIPKEALEQWGDQISGTTLKEGLGHIVGNFIIKEDAARKNVQEMLQTSPLMALIPHVVTDHSGFTAATIGSVQDDIDGRTIGHAANQFNWQAPWLYYSMTRVKEKHALDLDALVSFVSEAPWFPASREVLLREGLAAWLAADSIKAIHVLVPQVEAALRDILVGLGAPVVRHNSEIGGFEVVGMGAILDHAAFRSSFPKDCRFHLRAFYVDQRGINLRNQLAHGLAPPELLKMGVANWVVHTVLMLSALRIQEKHG